jgi:iron complex outermembrane receptor protein
MRQDLGVENSRFTSAKRCSVRAYAGAGIAALLAGSCPGVALAQPEAAGPQLDEVVVTAQRREENLQKVPITVTAIGGDVLEKAGVENTQQLTMLVPGLLGNTSSGAIIPVLRGIGVTSAQPGNDAPVANYVDGVFSPMNFQNTESLNNIERVEVLNGPQGTLFGRNASAGVIQVITKDPSPNAAADVAIGYGNYDTISGSFYGTTALGQNLSANLAVVSSDQRDGFGRATTVNRDIFKVRATTAQAKVRWDAGPNTASLASLLWQERKDNNSAIAILPGTVGGVNGVRYQSNGFYNTLDDTYPYNNATKYLGYLKARHEASFFDVVNIAAYQYAKVKNIQDFDATPIPYLAWNLSPTEKTFTEELQVLSKPDSPITWIVGLYYLHDRAHEDQLQFGTLLGSPTATSQVLADLETNSGAAYGQATIPFADKRANLTLGLRYTRDERQIVGDSFRNGVPGQPRRPEGALAEGHLSTGAGLQRDGRRARLRVLQSRLQVRHLHHQLADGSAGEAGGTRRLRGRTEDPVVRPAA